jgi:hypothetical protein
MIHSADLQAHIEDQGPWLFHATRTENVPSILEHGIQPGSELGRSNADGFHRTRSGHVYLWTLEHCCAKQRAGNVGEATIQVDLSQLDPSLIDPDEDVVQQAYFPPINSDRLSELWVAEAPPERILDWVQAPNGENTLWYWAENTPGFDAPEVTIKSLARGRISYRGTVPSGAISVYRSRAS